MVVAMRQRLLFLLILSLCAALGAAQSAPGKAPFNDSIRVADLKADLFSWRAMASRAGSSARPRTRWRPSSCDRARARRFETRRAERLVHPGDQPDDRHAWQ